jgi:hypothetical protein
MLTPEGFIFRRSYRFPTPRGEFHEAHRACFCRGSRLRDDSCGGLCRQGQGCWADEDLHGHEAVQQQARRAHRHRSARQLAGQQAVRRHRAQHRDDARPELQAGMGLQDHAAEGRQHQAQLRLPEADEPRVRQADQRSPAARQRGDSIQRHARFHRPAVLRVPGGRGHERADRAVEQLGQLPVTDRREPAAAILRRVAAIPIYNTCNHDKIRLC